MNLKDKKVLVMGLGISGISVIKVLDKYGAKIVIADEKSESQLKDILVSLGNLDLTMKLGGIEVDLRDIDLIVKSPGIAPRDKTLVEARKMDLEIINDIELGYRLSNFKNIVGITGTNGKTTTTSLIGEILKKADLNPHIAGNIGVGFLEEVLKSEEEDYFVLELSSFQLEHTDSFKAKVALILNISPDHLDWHGDYNSYIKSKKKIFKNQIREDIIVLNYDDPIVRGFENEINSKIIWFSKEKILDRGLYLQGEDIVYNNGLSIEKIISSREVKIIGKHNLENVLGVIGVSLALAIDLDIIRNAVKTFEAVEHRLEFVREFRGIKFFNDSKGTNPNASIKAIEALDGPMILIAGGYEKYSDFHDFILSFQDKVKSLILLGDTRERIRKAAFEHGYTDVILVDTMEEAVNTAYDLAREKDTVVLSPACASWGMYKNFEERGRDFKKLVHNLGDGHLE